MNRIFKYLTLPIICLLTLQATLHAAISIQARATPSFGTLQAGASGRTFTLTTADTVTTTNPDDYLTGAVTAEYNVRSNRNGGESATIMISNIVPSAGIQVDSFTCLFLSVTHTNCESGFVETVPKGWQVFRVGMTITTLKTHTAVDTESISYDLEIITP